MITRRVVMTIFTVAVLWSCVWLMLYFDTNGRVSVAPAIALSTHRRIAPLPMGEGANSSSSSTQFGTVKAAAWLNNAQPYRWFAVGERALSMVRFGRIQHKSAASSSASSAKHPVDGLLFELPLYQFLSKAGQLKHTGTDNVDPTLHTCSEMMWPQMAATVRQGEGNRRGAPSLRLRPATSERTNIIVALEVAVVLTTQSQFDAFAGNTSKRPLLRACLTDADVTDCALVVEGIPTGGIRLTFRQADANDAEDKLYIYALDMFPVLALAVPAEQTAGDGAVVRNKLVFRQEGHVPYASVFPLQRGHHGMASSTVSSIWVPARPLEVYSSIVASIGVGKQAATTGPSAAGRGCAELAYPPSLIHARTSYHTPYFPVKEAEDEFVRCARRLHAQGFASFAPECFAAASANSVVGDDKVFNTNAVTYTASSGIAKWERVSSSRTNAQDHCAALIRPDPFAQQISAAAAILNTQKNPWFVVGGSGLNMLRFGGTKRAGRFSAGDGGDNDIDCAIVVESEADYARVSAELEIACLAQKHLLNCSIAGSREGKWGIRFFTGYRNHCDGCGDTTDGRETYTLDLVPARMGGGGVLHNGERFGERGIPASFVFPLRPVRYNENVTMWAPRKTMAFFSALPDHDAMDTVEYGKGCGGVAYPPWLVKEYVADTDPYTKVQAVEEQFQKCARQLHEAGFASFFADCFVKG